MFKPKRNALMIDGFSDPHKIDDPTHLQKVIRHIISLANMELLNFTASNVELDISKIGRDPYEDEGGWSIVATISTSHVALHAWPEQGSFMFDLVSCRKFEPLQIKRALWHMLPVKQETFCQIVPGNQTTFTF